MNSRNVLFALMTLSVVGCFSSKPPKPLDNKYLSLICRGEFGFARLQVETDLGWQSCELPEDTARDLLKSLMPLKRVAPPEEPIEYDCELIYQSGHSPLCLDVKGVNGQLFFHQTDFARSGQEFNWYYQGGNAKEFGRIAEEAIGPLPKFGEQLGQKGFTSGDEKK